MGRFVFLKFWPLMKFLVFLFKFFPGFVFLFVWSLVSIFSGKFAVLLRYFLFSSRLEKFDKNAYIGTHVVLKNIHNMKVGENFSLHDFCYIDALGGIFIGKNVSIAHGSSLVSFNHTWDDPTVPIKYNDVEKKPIVIEDDVWIGCGVRVMPGVTIGKRCIIAAGAVVATDVPENTIVAGVPAKVVKYI